MSLFRFEEHDIFLPMIVLEELDGHKKGTTEVARNARQASRIARCAGRRARVPTSPSGLQAGHHRPPRGRRQAVLPDRSCSTTQLPTGLPQGKADNQILGVVQALREAARARPRSGAGVQGHQHARQGARAGPGHRRLPERQDARRLRPAVFRLAGPAGRLLDQHGKTVESWQSGQHTFYRISGPIVPSLLINQFVYFESPGEPSLYARVTEIRAKTAVLKTLKDYGAPEERGLGRRPRATASRTSR